MKKIVSPHQKVWTETVMLSGGAQEKGKAWATLRLSKYFEKGNVMQNYRMTLPYTH